MFEKFFAKIAGKVAARKLKLEDKPMETKAWYKSKTIWSDIATIVLAIVGLVDMHFTDGKIAQSPIYSIILSLLGGMGIYTRKKADTKIG